MRRAPAKPGIARGSRRHRGLRVLAGGPLAGVLVAGLLGAGPVLAEEAPSGGPAAAEEPGAGAEASGIPDGAARYRMEPRPSGGVWRLDTRTGEVCVFGFPGSQPGAAVLNAGCSVPMGTEDGERNGRFELAPRPGGEIWRLDRLTGRLCIFSYRPGQPSPIVVEGCSRDEEQRGL